MIERAAFFETQEGGLRPYLINGPDRCLTNPHLIIANSRKGKKMARRTIVMHRNRRGQFVKGRASNPRRHHRRRRRNYVTAGGAVFPMANRRRRGRRRNYVTRHHYSRRRKHNPTLPLPGIGTVDFPFSTVLGVTAGLALPPITQGILTNTFGMQATAAQYPTLMTIGSNAAVLAGAYFAFGRTAARDVLVGEVAGFLVKQIQSIAMTTGAALQRPVYYAGGRMAGYMPPTARGRVMAGYTPPTARGRVMAGYPFTTHQRGMALLNGGLGQINNVRRGSRLQSRFNQL